MYRRIQVGNARPNVVSSGWRPVDERDHEFLTGERAPEGYFRVEGGIESEIARASATRRTPT